MLCCLRGERGGGFWEIKAFLESRPVYVQTCSAPEGFNDLTSQTHTGMQRQVFLRECVFAC